MNEANNRAWLKWCPFCKRGHLVRWQPCPECRVHQTQQPVSKRVADDCPADYACGSCIAYHEHLV